MSPAETARRRNPSAIPRPTGSQKPLSPNSANVATAPSARPLTCWSTICSAPRAREPLGRTQAAPTIGVATDPSGAIIFSSTSLHRCSTSSPCSDPLMIRIRGTPAMNLMPMPVSEKSWYITGGLKRKEAFQ